MEKLTLKEIAGYLNYKLELQYIDSITQRKRIAILTSLGVDEIETTYKRKIKGCSGDLISWQGHNSVHKIQVKPILYPLSMLTKPIVHNGVEIIPIVEINKIHTLEFKDGLFNDYVSDGFHIEWLPKLITDKLFEWHFDIHGLIEKGLAIDKSKI